MKPTTLQAEPLLPAGAAGAEDDRWVTWVTVGALLAVGIYQSILWFGYQVVPSSDFSAFVQVGRELLHGQMPSSFKRAPVLGMLQVALSTLVGGEHPELTAGRLLNALLHPGNILLVWAIGRRLVGTAAFAPALLYAANGYVLSLLVNPIAETTLVFFVLLTFWLLGRRSRWAYVAAAVTTMVRYEGAALIMAAGVQDLLSARQRRERLYVLGRAALAGVPLALWMLGTFTASRPLGSMHYLNVLRVDAALGRSCLKYLQLVAQVGIDPLWLPAPGATLETARAWVVLTRGVTVIVCLAGVVFGLKRQRGFVLTLVIFFLLYSLVHVAMPDFLYRRFALPVFWMVWLLGMYGGWCLWESLVRRVQIPVFVTMLLQVGVTIGVLVRLGHLVPYLDRAASWCPRAASLPYVLTGGAGLITICYVASRRGRSWAPGVAGATVLAMMLGSSKPVTAQILGDGKNDIEFKYLAEWYRSHARPGERMLTTMKPIVALFLPDSADCLVHTGNVRAESWVDFLRRCRERNITYVAWDSRLGLARRDPYYKLWRLESLAPLGRPRNVGPFEFLTRLDGARPYRYIYVFRFHPERLSSAPSVHEGSAERPP